MNVDDVNIVLESWKINFYSNFSWNSDLKFDFFESLINIEFININAKLLILGMRSMDFTKVNIVL